MIKQKIQKLIKGISIFYKHPSYINKVINDNDTWKEEFRRKWPFYINGVPVVDLANVISSPISINCYSFLNGGSLVTDLALLKGLAKSISECKYFEIGTWRGESVVNVAECAASCYTMNLSDDEMRQIHGNQRIIDQTGLFITNQSNITRIEANTLTYDFAGLGKKFDLIFIDGDHQYNAICNDTLKVFSHLIHEESIVVWHDYAYSPDFLRYEVMSAILDSVPVHLHANLYHVRNTNCCIFHPLLQASVAELQCPDYPYFNFKIDLTIELNKL